MATLKEKVIGKILELLEVDGKEDYVELTENFKKMGRKPLDILLEYIEEMPPAKSYRKTKRTEANVPVHLVPADIDTVKNPDQMGAQLEMLPVVSQRLMSTFRGGDFPAMKRNVGIIDRITLNVRKLTAQQLWDGINIYKDMPDLVDVDDDDDSDDDDN